MEQVVEISSEIEKEVAEQQIADLSIEMLGLVGGGAIALEL
jgi:hypothetical protein